MRTVPPGAEAVRDRLPEPEALELVPEGLSDDPALLAAGNGAAELVEELALNGSPTARPSPRAE